MPSRIYFSRIRVRGKLIRRSLKTDTLSAARLRPGDLEKFGRPRVEIQGAVSSGNIRFREALAVIANHNHNDTGAAGRARHSVRAVPGKPVMARTE